MPWQRNHNSATDSSEAEKRAPDAAPTQLSSPSSVPTDMSTMAISGTYADAMRPATLPDRPTDPFPASGEAPDDAQFMLRVRAGDDEAFNYLVGRYRRPMIGFMYRMTHDTATAEDLAQEVFLRVYRSRASYQADAKFTTWLYRIATNLAMNHARDNKHERPEEKASLDAADEQTGMTLDVADVRPSIEQQILHHERMAAIRQRIEALPERQRAAVLMHKYQEMDYRQIAAVLHLSESATKSLLFRAYESLRQSLKEFL